MVKIFENKEFSRFYDRNSGSVFFDLEFRKCRFVSSVISITKQVPLRSVIRNVVLKDCESLGCWLDNPILEDVYVDGFKTNQLFQTWGAAFQHVTLKGKIGRVMISSIIAPGKATPEEQQAFNDANQDYYAGVDWALDLRDASCEEFQVQGIPAKLIRRDPETQVIVTRASAMKGEWRSLDLSGTWWHVSLKQLLDSGHHDVVLVAPKRNKAFKKLLSGLKLLREAGVANPD